MPHAPKPFYRKARNAWFIQVGTQQTKLCDGPKTAATEKQAWEQFHLLKADRINGIPAITSNPGGPSVAQIFEKYLEWCSKNRAASTYEWYQDRIQNLCHSLTPSATVMPATGFRPFHIADWIDKKITWGDTYKRGAIIAIQRPFNWAVKMGYLDANPIRNVEKPRARRRERLITAADLAAILAYYELGDPFRDLVEFLWETGCRPQEARHIEPRHFNADLVRFEIPPQEAKGKKRWRIIRLTVHALEIARRRIEKCNGKVFANEDGHPWTAYSIGCRFSRLKKKIGTKYCAYSFRHGFCQRLLEKGVDHLTVAELLGHANGLMVSSTYSHMNQADDHLLKALEQAG